MTRQWAWWIRELRRPPEWSGPEYRRLAARLLDLITARRIEAGTQLPPERVLSVLLAVSRGTVVRAYDDLAADGFVERRVGSGTFVRQPPAWGAAARPTASSALRALAHSAGVIDLAAAPLLPPAAVPVVPAMAGWSADESQSLHAVVRAEIARLLTTVLAEPVRADDITLTAGRRHGTQLALAALRRGGYRLVGGCPSATVAGYDARGAWLPGCGRRRVGPGRSRLAIVVDDDTRVCDGQDDAGGRLAGSAPWVVVDADPMVLLGAPADPRWRPARNDAPGPTGVVRVGSLTPIVGSDSRVGWVHDPQRLVTDVVRGQLQAGGTAPSVAAILPARQALPAIDGSWTAQFRERVDARTAYFVALAREVLPSWRVRRQEGYPAVWVELPTQDTDVFAEIAAEAGVLVTPGTRYCPSGLHRGRLRLSLSVAEYTLEAAVHRLAGAWRTLCELQAQGPA